jgi:hypothetical protein
MKKKVETAGASTLEREVTDFSLMVFCTDQFPYDMIQDACNSKWCHIGMTLTLTEAELQTLIEDHRKFSNAETRTTLGDETRAKTKKKTGSPSSIGFDYYLFESTTDTNRCYVTGKYESSVKMSLLRDRLCKYTEPELGYKKSAHVGSDPRKKKALKTKLLRDVLPTLIGRPYESNMCNLVKAWCHWIWCSPKWGRRNIEEEGESLRCFYTGHGEDTMFCTEVLVHALTELEAMKSYHGPRSTTPIRKKIVTPSKTKDSGKGAYAIIKIGLDEESPTDRRETREYSPNEVESRCCGTFGYGGYTDEDPIIVDLIELDEFSPYMREDSPLNYERLCVYKRNPGPRRRRRRKEASQRERYEGDEDEERENDTGYGNVDGRKDDNDDDGDDETCFLSEWEKTRLYRK